MLSSIEHVSIICFVASYSLALGLEVWHLWRPNSIAHWCANLAGTGGLLAHFLYLKGHPLPFTSTTGSFLFLAAILAIFYLYGSFHYRQLAWGLFVLPLILGLIGLGVYRYPADLNANHESWQRVWILTHVGLLLLAGVGVCVAFIASTMYLVQVYRLRAKMLPNQGIRLMSLERLETMNRRAVLWAFPLLSAGLLIGIGLQYESTMTIIHWESPQIVSTLLVWLVFVILLYLRYSAHVRGRLTALLTMLAFVLLLVALVSPAHPFAQGVMP